MSIPNAQFIKDINRIAVTTEGYLEGVRGNDPAYTVFRGVPYARPPVGELRWASAVPPEKYGGVRKADTFPPVSLQREQLEGTFYQKEFYTVPVPQSEDCLYLNIWTPAVNTAKRLPIMFWIHGGAFMSGYSYEKEFDGEAFCRRDCILVTVAYRLGALGFFAHPELSARDQNGISGNYGISDCIQALRWVKANAPAFGGDSERITIFGQSAGGAMVQSLITCPLAKGLFARAIIQSARGFTTLRKVLSLADFEQLGVEACKKAGTTLNELMSMPGAEVNTLLLKTVLSERSPSFRLSVCVDGYYQPKAAGEAIVEGEILDVDILTGSVDGDGDLFGARLVSTMEEYEDQIASYGELQGDYRRLFGVKTPDDLPAYQKARAAITSRETPCTWAEAYARKGHKPLYIYYFNRKMPGDNAGAFHSSELWYIFGTLDRCWRSTAPGFGAGDYTLSRAMTDYWTNFAKTGDPNGDSVPLWPSYSTGNPVTLYLDEKKIAVEDTRNIKLLSGLVELHLKAIYGKSK